ncbi:TerC family protein [Kribbella sp. NPDC003557]|uniref:TerC family protein n=1 Tax=Kribbella sp. NPDC003557 TaxID=3154449 RepID=UPI0033A0A2BE
MHVADYVWYITVGLLLALLAFDVFVIGRRPHEPSTRESATAIAFYIGLAVIFGLGVWYFSGGRYAGEFFAGWLTEYSLSVDNLFIFLIIMARFGVPRKYQQTALLVGIILALVFRGVFIAVGAAAINQFSWIFYLFGAFLVYTAIHLAKQGENDDDDYKENAVIRFAKRRLNATDEYNGVKLTVKKNGKRLVTPMAIVIIALGTTDLLFALDSIPAIYGLTQEPFLVFTANVFALMGLRQLYFLLGDLLRRLVYLSLGLSVVLAFIGVKLVLHAMHVNELPFINGGHHIEWAPEIPIWFSLGFIIITLGITTVASLHKSRTMQSADESAALETADSTGATEAEAAEANGRTRPVDQGDRPQDAVEDEQADEPAPELHHRKS